MPIRSPDHLVVECENLKFMRNFPKDMKVDTVVVDVIYNTKNRDLRYSDNNPNWSAFMRDRIEAASKLMADHASIFIHIDDRQHHHLRFVCDEVFGPRNFVANLIWRKSHTVKNDKRGICTQHEYVLCYAKDDTKVTFNREQTGADYIGKAYRYEDARGKFRVLPLFKDKNANSYPVTAPNGTVWEKNWNYNRVGFDKLLSNDLVYWGKNGNSCPTKKLHLKGAGEMTKPFGTMLDPLKVGYTGCGGKALQALGFKRTDFLYPKPPELIQHILEISTQPDSLVLDVFAGSGTTGEAVFMLNQRDGGTRRVILCNSNENDICRKLTHPRTLRAAQLYGEKRKVTFLRAVGGEASKVKFERDVRGVTAASGVAPASVRARRVVKGGVRAPQTMVAGVAANAR